MKKITAVIIGVSLATISFTAAAQDEEAPELYTYASYFTCPGGSLEAADAEIAADQERMDGLVADGTISRWGYLAHHTGGSWQRIFYYQADSLDALLDGSDAIQDTGDDDGDAAGEEKGPSFGEVCNRHDDYIWQVQNGTIGADRGAVGFSVYHVCDIAREDRADEIVAEHFAPILNTMVEDGQLASWGWSSHVVGGKYRKLQTMTAADHKSLLAARGAAITALYADDDAAGNEFTEICGPHVDYMWNIVHEST